MTCQDIRDLLNAVNAGTVPVSEPFYVDPCTVGYTLQTGHIIRVFDDAGEWDYVDEVLCPNGRHLDFDQLYPCVEGVRQPEGLNGWEPNFEVFHWKSVFFHEVEEP